MVRVSCGELQTEPTTTLLSIKSLVGKICLTPIHLQMKLTFLMFSPKTGEFIIISKAGKIVAYFKPENPPNFIENKFDECGDYWLNY